MASFRKVTNSWNDDVRRSRLCELLFYFFDSCFSAEKSSAQYCLIDRTSPSKAMPILVPVFFVVICAINLRLSESLGTFTTNSLTMSGVASKHTFGQSVMSIAFDLFEGGYTNADTLGTGYVGDYDFFLSRYQSGSSTASWTTLFGTSGFDQMTSMAVNSLDVNSYVVGMCSGTVNGVATKGSGDACIFKLDGSGNVVCSNQFGGTGKDIFTSVAYDIAEGVVYVVGNTTSPSFEGTSTSGAASGIWMSIKISDCTVINQYVQSYTTSSSPSTQIVSFDSVTAIPTVRLSCSKLMAYLCLLGLFTFDVGRFRCRAELSIGRRFGHISDRWYHIQLIFRRYRSCRYRENRFQWCAYPSKFFCFRGRLDNCSRAMHVSGDGCLVLYVRASLTPYIFLQHSLICDDGFYLATTATCS